MAITVGAIVVFFVAGMATSGFFFVCYGIREEERRLSLTRHAPNRVSARTRSLIGLYVRRPSDRQAETKPDDTMV